MRRGEPGGGDESRAEVLSREQEEGRRDRGAVGGEGEETELSREGEEGMKRRTGNEQPTRYNSFLIRQQNVFKNSEFHILERQTWRGPGLERRRSDIAHQVICIECEDFLTIIQILSKAILDDRFW